MLYFFVCFAVIVIDQLTKYYVVNNFFEGESIVVIENVFHWTYILNPGAAFGVFAGARWVFVAIALAVAAALWLLRKELAAGDIFTKLGAALFLGGACGNLIDRVRNGLVVDFFDFRIWPVFNVADIAICAGVGFVLWSLLKTEFVQNGEN